MGYGNSTGLADAFLTQKIELALAKKVSELVGGTGVTGQLAQAINSQPREALARLVPKVKGADGITAESTDSDLDTALFNTDSQEMLKKLYGIS